MSNTADAKYEEPKVLWQGPVALTRIRRDPSLQVRNGGTRMDVVKEYSNAIKDPMDHLPAIDVFTTAAVYNENCSLLLSDGYHRSEAYEVASRPTIPVRVLYGDAAAALRHAIAMNAQHGVPFTHKERVALVKRLLDDPDQKDLSVRQIAALVGVSKSTVQNIKSPPPKPAPKTRTTSPETKPETKTAEAAANPAFTISESETKPEIGPGIIEDQRSNPSPDGPAVMPAMVRERQPSELPTRNERIEQLKYWVDSGHIERADVMNLFATPDGRLAWIPRNPTASKKILFIRCGDEILIETEVRINAEMPGFLDVEVANRHLVEYAAPVEEQGEEMLAAG